MANHFWTDEESDAFIGFMEEIVLEGRRAENGQFKLGSFEKLALKMNVKFPGCVFMTNHCKNKHKRIKEKFQFAHDMMQCSEFGWDDYKQCVVVDSPYVLESWLKSHSQRLYTPGKPFPHLPRLEKIFGKDRAIGNYSQSGNDINEEVQQEVNEQQENNTINLSDEDLDESDSPVQQPTSMSSMADKMKGRKKVRRQSGDAVMFKELNETVKNALAEQGKHLEAISRAMAGSAEVKEAGTVLTNLGFTDQEILLATRKIMRDLEEEKIFWTLSDRQKVTYVREILG